MTRTILLVDDDETLRSVLAEQLRLHEEFETGEAGTAEEAVEALEARQFDAVILDVGLPDMDGRELCRTMRSRGVKVPIVMLTGVDTDEDTVRGFDAGANDYVAKPFRFEVLLARLRAHLRQHERSHDAALDIGGYKFRPAYKQLLNGEDGRTVRLTEKETAILQYLYRAGGATVSRGNAAAGGLGLPAGHNHAHARNAYLPPEAEDRARPAPHAAPGDGARRIPAGVLTCPALSKCASAACAAASPVRDRRRRAMAAIPRASNCVAETGSSLSTREQGFGSWVRRSRAKRRSTPTYC